jgi:1D-myo-inositol 3-kinase
VANEAAPADVPDVLLVGPATRDLLPDGGWRLGGTVTFAALTAHRLGYRPAVVTAAPEEVASALRDLLPGVSLAVVPSAQATTFENVYEHGVRRQHLRGRAATLTLADVPGAWRSAPLVLLAPLADDVDPTLASAFPKALVAATPQGWLRRWDDSGAVTPSPLAAPDILLPSLGALILSRDDLLPAPGADMPATASVSATPEEADTQIAAWARVVPLVAVTRGRDGAALYRDGGALEAFPGYPVEEVDPTGAGDVFAAAFLCHLRTTGDPRVAADFANRVAALSIEHPGATGIPTRNQVVARFG